MGSTVTVAARDPARLADCLIGAIHASSGGVYGGVYGSWRVRAELVHGHGVIVGRNTVRLLMVRAGLHGLPTRKVRRRSKLAGVATAADLVDRRFGRTGPNQLWVTDITEHPTRKGKL